MRIVKFKQDMKTGRISVTYEIPATPGTFDEYALSSSDLPGADLTAAMVALVPDVLALLELPDTDDERERVTLTGVTVSYTENATGYTLIAQRRLEESSTPMNLVTPCKFNAYPSGTEYGDPKQLIDAEIEDRLDDLFAELCAYVTQKRARDARRDRIQLELPMEETATGDDLHASISVNGGPYVSLEQFERGMKMTAQLLRMTDRQLEMAGEQALKEGKVNAAAILNNEMTRRQQAKGMRRKTTERQPVAAVAATGEEDW